MAVRLLAVVMAIVTARADAAYARQDVPETGPPGEAVETVVEHEGPLEGPIAAPAPAGPPPAVVRRADCIVFYESRWNHLAVNRRSGASGLGQFLPSTWRTTPLGKLGYSVFDPYANHAMVVWMLQVGRAREFEVVTRGLC